MRCKRVSIKLLALACLFLSTPGMTEIVEDLAHYALEGHTVHSEDAPDHDESEHGCSGMYHHCVCCAHVFALVREHSSASPSGSLSEALPPPHPIGEERPGYTTPPFRPPTV